MTHNVLIFGFGYTAIHFVEQYKKNGYKIFATNRTKKHPIKGVHFINFDIEDIQRIMPQINIILICIPPVEEGYDILFKKFHKIIIENKNHILWLGYLSSTAVYGNHNGKWVNESSTLLCNNTKALQRLKAEKNWLSLYNDYNIPIHIFRLSGIYGIGRNAIEKIINGKTESIVKKDHFFSRIHITDIINILINSILNPTPGEIFNISDNLPAPLYKVDQYASQLIKTKSIKFITYRNDLEISPMLKNFFLDNKKISNEKIIDILNINLIYPNYREGLKYGCLPYIK